MSTINDLNQAILDDATEGIARAQNDQGVVEMMTIEDRLKAKNAGVADGAANHPHRGLRFTKLNSPGTV